MARVQSQPGPEKRLLSLCHPRASLGSLCHSPSSVISQSSRNFTLLVALALLIALALFIAVMIRSS